MKFILCLTLIVFGAFGVFAEDTTPYKTETTEDTTVAKESTTPSTTSTVAQTKATTAAPTDATTAASTEANTATPTKATTAGTTEATTAAPTETTTAAPTEANTATPTKATTAGTTEATTAAPTEATTAAPANPILNIIDELNKVAKNFGDAIVNATKGLGNAASDAAKNVRGSGVSGSVLNPVISSIDQVVQDVINGISKTAFSGINSLLNSTAQQLSDASKRISNLQDCANKNGQSSVNIAEPLEKLLQCPVNAFIQAGSPVGKAVQVITQIGASITSDVTGAIKCFATPILGFIPNVECFAGIGIQSILRGLSDTSNVFSLGSSIFNDIMTVIPNSVDCFNQQWNGIVQTFTKSGVNVAQCLE